MNLKDLFKSLDNDNNINAKLIKEDTRESITTSIKYACFDVSKLTLGREVSTIKILDLNTLEITLKPVKEEFKKLLSNEKLNKGF